MSTASKTVLLRLTPDEHAALSSLSQETGLSLSRLVVSRVLGGAGSPASEVARARAALQAALKALDGEEAPQVVEPVVTTPVVEPVEPVANVEEPVVESVAPVDLPAPPPAPKPLPPTIIQDLVSTRYLPDWIKAVRSIYRNGNTSHAITQPEHLPTYLKVDKEYRIRRGTMIVAAVGTVVYCGWTRDGRVEWDETTRYDWDERKATTIDRLCAELTSGPPWRRDKKAKEADPQSVG